MLDYSREFLALAEELNFVKAAARLHMSQPSLTRHIAGLEQQLGFKLLDRNPMRLTPAGLFYLGAIGNVIAQVDDIVQQSRRIASQHDARLVINMMQSSNNQFANVIYESMAVLHDRHPYYPSIHMLSDRSVTIPCSVFSGKADIGVVFSRPAEIPEGFVCELMLELPLMVWMHEDNPLSRRKCITVKDLKDCYLVRPSGPNLLASFEGAEETLQNHGIEPKWRHRELAEFDRIPFTIQPDEILFKTAQYHAHPLPVSFLAEKHFSNPVPLYSIYLLYKKDSTNPMLSEFVAICRHIATTRIGSNEEVEAI